MKIVYLIGNSFDLNLGLKTKHSDFYNYYYDEYSPNASVKKLKDNIQNNTENWSDLELKLGKYTKEINFITELDEISDDLREKLSKYLQKEEWEFDYSLISLEKIYEYLEFPENYLLRADKENLSKYKQEFGKSTVNIDIVSFNYTKSLEKILQQQNKKDNIKIASINHIHGDTNNGMLIGVNERLQITNEKFHDDDFLDILVKPKANQVQKHNIDIQCKENIQNADLICIFGSSIGEIDKMWWKLIGDTLSNKVHFRIIIFSKGKIIPNIESHKIGRKEREIKNLFLNRTSLNDKQKDSIINRIFIGYNTEMFNLNQNKKND